MCSVTPNRTRSVVRKSWSFVCENRRPVPGTSPFRRSWECWLYWEPGFSNKTIESLRARGLEIDPGRGNVSAVVELIVSNRGALAGAATRGGPAKPWEIDSGLSGD